MNLLRQFGTIVGTALLLLLLWAVAANMPKFKRVIPEAGYRDMSQIDKDDTTGVDGTVTVRQLRRGDIVAFYPSAEDDAGAAFGYVAALPGETMTISDGTLRVDDEAWDKTSIPQSLGDVEALPIPADHVYLLSDGHQFDSTRLGPIPAAFLIGRVKD